jgi:hypothetical protein
MRDMLAMNVATYDNILYILIYCGIYFRVSLVLVWLVYKEMFYIVASSKHNNFKNNLVF